jgi:hypothetical protein
MLTPKGTADGFRSDLTFRISARRASGVGCVSAVRKPRAPALDTAEISSARPTHIMPPWTIGTRIPRVSVSQVLIAILDKVLSDETKEEWGMEEEGDAREGRYGRIKEDYLEKKDPKI